MPRFVQKPAAAVARVLASVFLVIAMPFLAIGNAFARGGKAALAFALVYWPGK